MKSPQHFFVLIVSCLLLAACNGKEEFQPLKSGEGLRADCSILINSFPEGEIPQNVWPKSVKELAPVRVVREKNAVRIFVEREKFRGGYWVSPDPQLAPSTQNVWIQKTEHKGIYQFRMY
jgi:hypothetical protein